jgi:transcription elongation factor GreB
MTLKRNLVTYRGYIKLCRELDDLLHIKRPPLLDAVKIISDDNIQESSAYQLATAELIRLDTRIGKLRIFLDSAEIIYPELQQDKSSVYFGATVTYIMSGGFESTYMLVGKEEANLYDRTINWQSPIGQALLNARIGDWVTVDYEFGEGKLLILDIQYD